MAQSSDSVDTATTMETLEQVCRRYNIRHASTPNGYLLSAADFGKALGMGNIRERIATLDSRHKVMMPVQTIQGSQSMIFVTMEGVRYILSKSRKVSARQLALEFGMTVTDNHFVAVEPAVVRFITTAFSGETFVTQYRVGVYMIDLFIPRVLVAIEVDEESAHGNYNKEADQKRQLHIETAIPGCRFIRCRPEESGFYMATLVNKVWNALK